MFENFEQFALLAALGAAIVKAGWTVYADGEVQYKQIAVIVVVVGLFLMTGLDLFVQVGLPLSVDYVGSALSGVLGSLGANIFYDVTQRAKRPA